MEKVQSALRKPIITTNDIVQIAIFVAILFIQEQILSLLPNVQLTVFFIILFAKKIKTKNTAIIVFIHVLLDNLFNSFNVIMFITMLVGWGLTVLITKLFFDKTENIFLLAICAIICSFVYSWCFIFPFSFLFQMTPIQYLVGDVVFELILAGCGFISTLILYKPCARALEGLKVC